MPRKKGKSLTGILSLCLLVSGLHISAYGRISKTSKRILRPKSAVTTVISDLRGTALSTSSIQWSWSTGTFSGIDGYHLYSSSTTPLYITLLPETSYYIDTSLGVNKVYTRWLTAYQGATEGSDSEHIDKYTYALPPDTISVPVSSVNATNAYVTWHFSTATAYAIETSSDNGVSYFRNREAFVPWQTIQLLSNTTYNIRLGAVNGDDEVTPNVYSAVKVITTFPLDPELTAVAVSSWSIKWQWSTGTFTGTGITGYRLYRSSGSEAEIPPNFYNNVQLVHSIAGADTTSWTEVFIDSETAVANSRHARWLKAVGFLESEGHAVVQRYTYGIAPATCTAIYPNVNPVLHVYQNGLDLNWNIGWSSTTQNGVASTFFIEVSTFHITSAYALELGSIVASGAPFSINTLTENTKYDLRVGAINGDGEATPNNADNPFAYSDIFRAITRPAPPSGFSCNPLTDTALRCYWSTTTTSVNPTFITGYGIGEYKYDAGALHPTWYWDPLNIVAETASHEDRLDYFLTNSTHTVTIYTNQEDPDYVSVHGSDPAWYYNGPYTSYHITTAAATFATPPNDVAFDIVRAREIGLWWKEPEVPATQYFVTRSTTTGEKGPWVFISSVTGSHYTDTGPLIPSTTYSYRIGAINLSGLQTIGLSTATDGNRRDYSFVRSTITKHISPTLSGVGTSTTSITWSWTDTVPGVTSYNLYTSTGGVLVTGISTSTPFYTEVNLSSANARYTRQVRSIASDGEGDYSEASVFTLANPPAAMVVTSSGIHSLSLAWSASDATRYKIDRSTDRISWTVLKDWGAGFVSTSLNDTRLRYAATYYYSVLGYNEGGFVSISSAITAANMTLPLPSAYTVVFATSAATATAPLPDPSVALLTVDIPVGTPDGYLVISTNAATSPVDIPKSSLDAATHKLKNASLVSGSIVELHLYDVFGASSNITVPARITITYTDANSDDIVDGASPQAQADTLNLFNLDTGALVWGRENSVVNKTVKSVYSDVSHFSFYALGSVSEPAAFSGTPLSPTSLQWSWPTVPGIDSYHLYTSSASGYIVLPSTKNFYVDTGLGVNKPYTRWLKTFSGGVEGNESAHIQKYTYALPPASIALSTLTAESVYVTWSFSTATAYAIECSTDGGEDYIQNRAAFVPWQTIPLLSNASYYIRMGAINGDNEVTPGLYSATYTFTTPPLDLTMTGVALSSYSIHWQWSTGTFTGTGITGYRVYSSTGGVVYSAPAIDISSWTETFVGGITANSLRTRWIRAVGLLESPGWTAFSKFTYAIAPATCGAVSPDSENVYTDSVNLNWEPRLGPSEANRYVIDYSTAGVAENSADFDVFLTSVIVTGAPSVVTGLAWGTKHDFRVGAINGDDEQTPDNALNPYAYSARYKVITKPVNPVQSCSALTDTSLRWSWSTGTYTDKYVSGYTFNIASHTEERGDFWLPSASISGVSSNEYEYNPANPYLLTNSTHTGAVAAVQSWSPGCADSPSDPACYYFFGSNAAGSTCATFATPPNNVVFDTVTSREVGIWWKEPEIQATQYRVERSTTTGEQGPWIFLSSVTGTHFQETGLTPSTTYSYRLGAINRMGFQTIGLSSATDGNRRDYSFISSTITKHVAPTLSGAGASTTSITWSWIETVPGVTSYNLYTSSGVVIATGISTSTPFYTEVNLSSANTRYTRRIRSIASDGEGDYSEASAFTLANPPAAAVVTSSGIHSMSLAWSAGDATRYKIDRSTDGISWTVIKDWNAVFVSTSFSDTRLRYAATYYYAVLGYNNDGSVSISSAITSNMTLPLPPAYTMVFATAAATATAPLPDPSVALITVDIPVGTPDGYFVISTNAATSPVDISKSSLDAATHKLTDASLVPGSIVELHLYDVYGASSNITVPARITIIYTDANSDDLVDGTAPQARADTLNLFNLDTNSLVWDQQISVVSTSAKSVYSEVGHFSFYALGSVSVVEAFSAAALSPTSIKWSWPRVSGIDSYHLYTSSASGYMVLPSSASFYVDTGLGVNKPYTRWLKTFSGGVEGNESAHIQKYTYALPPASIALSTLTAESVYVTWSFSTATAYAIECSTDGGEDYIQNRAAFVPWQTIPLLSNASYYIRMGAINGDNEVTPGLYSATHTFTTPPLDLTMTGVALSSYSIHWQWSTGTFTGTGITGYRVYSSTGGVVYSAPAINISSWTETFVEGITANSLHMRWIRAVGLLESPGWTAYSKYTYAVAPATCGLVSPDFENVHTDSVNLSWEPRLGPSEAAKYVIDYATAGVTESSADFNVSLTSVIVAGAPSAVTGLAWDTKHDFRIGAINGDNEQTPDNALNPYAYSARYKVITKPVNPVHSCSALTDTSLRWSWSTGTYTGMNYITGYGFGILRNTVEWGDFWEPLDYIPGVSSNEYDYNPPAPYWYPDPYLLTNSTHTRGLWVEQSWTPSCYNSPDDPACYNFYGSNGIGATCATFATPPNNVAFDIVTSRDIGIWWKEPEIPATQYRVERSTTTGEQGPWVFLSSVTGTHFQETGLTPSTTYFYRIGAINQLGVQTIGLSSATDGNRRDYSFISSTITKHVAPTLSGAGASTTSITWSWIETVPGVTSYNLYTSSGVVIATGISTSTPFYTEVNLSSANTRYTRRIRSIASDGEGDYSEASAFTLANPPAAAVVTSSGIHSMSLAWSAGDATRYKIDRSTDGISWTVIKDWNAVFVSTSFSDTRLRYAATYYYAVLSYNNDGTVSISSATTSNMTLPLPSTYTVVFATAAATATAPLPAPSVALITVDIPIGTPDGYFGISTNAATSPADIPKTSLDAATHKLRNAALVSGSIVELHLYDVYGDQSDITAPARITITYTDANSDDIVDGAVPQAQADTLNLFNLDTSALVWNRQTSVVNKSVKNVYSDVDHFSFYALGSAVSAGGAFSATTLSTASIQWSWSTGSGVDGYHLYSSSASGYIVLPSTTGSYIDTGLRVNKAYTRWLKVSSGTAEINESAHVQKYTYALPPDAIPVVDTITASSGYMEWHFSAATAYEIECSTNDGVDYVHNRASFVPWQTIPLLSNKRYLVRLGAINGDNEVTPGIYSATRTFITPPLTVSSFTAVALSSYTIKWQWETEMFAGTDISGYRIYQSTTTPDAGLPTDSAEGISVKELNANTSFWIETFTDGAVPASNSRHTRSLKAVGNIVDNGNFLVSQKMPYFQKYTYAIAPATTTVVYLDPAPYLVAHVGENSLTLTWDVSEGAPRPGDGIASKYVIDHSTVPGFTIAVTSSIVGQPPQSAAGLTDNTKYDLRIGAINGDNEQTPTDALNPSAYSAGYKVMTTPKPPSAFLCAPHTDTAMRCTWSTSTYVNPDYIYGYEIGELHHRTVDGKDEIYWDPFNFLAGIDSHEYSLDYLMTNSTHTVSIWALQTDPDWVTGNIHYDTHTYDGGDWDCSFHYCHWGSNRLDYAGYTFATPPNDVSFDTIAARSIGTWWKEPIIPATKYRVERSTNIGENGPWVFVSSVTGNHYNDTGLTPSTTYSYRVGAINLLGIQTLGLADATTGYRRDYSFVQSTMTVQRSPTLYAIATSTASIGWWWTNDVPDVLFYNMYTSTNGILASHLTNTTNYWLEVNLSSANTRYTRRIRSVTQMGESDFSEASGVTFAADPTALAVTGAGLHSLSIEWSGNGGTSYRIDRSTDMNSWSPLKTWTDVYISTAFTDTHLRLATTYYYAASAYNQDAILSLGSATYSGGPSRTLDLPAGLFPVFSTETVTQSTTVALPGFGWITVQLPAGAAPFDGYIMISTAAETNPLETSAANINTATSKLLPSKLVPGSIAELYFYDLYGSTYTGNFVVPAVIQYTYMDADSDDILDGTSPQIRADTLKLLNLDTANLVWNPQSASRLDKAAKMVYSDINHFSFYALGSIITVTSSLADMRAYPNPYKPGSGGDFDQSVFGEGIVFEGLTARAKIRIYNIAGLLVAELNDDDGDGRCLWNARNGGGARVASGIYIYSVTNPGGSGGKKSGKITIIK